MKKLKSLSALECDANTLKYEKCVLCGVRTEVPENTSIDSRKDYINGCGQLCERCFADVLREKVKTL